MRTTVTFEGNLADDPQVRFTGSGKQITEITVPVNQRRQNNDGEWVELEPTRHVVRAFKTLAENVAESLAKGDRLFVHGTIATDVWTDKQTGEKRTTQRVLADIVGPSCGGPRHGSPRPPAPRPPTSSCTTSASRRADQAPIESGDGVGRDPRRALSPTNAPTTYGRRPESD